jgi:hypothetical protein
MRLVLGSRQYDLTTRALVLGLSGAPEDGPMFAVASDEAAVERALADGADLVRLTHPSAGSLKRCAAAGAAVVVPADACSDATAAGLAAERIVPDTLLVEVGAGAGAGALAATVAGVIGGARIVRTADVRAARRVCDVLAAVWEAGDR